MASLSGTNAAPPASESGPGPGTVHAPPPQFGAGRAAPRRRLRVGYRRCNPGPLGRARGAGDSVTRIGLQQIHSSAYPRFAQ